MALPSRRRVAGVIAPWPAPRGSLGCGQHQRLVARAALAPHAQRDGFARLAAFQRREHVVEVVHRLQAKPLGKSLATLDRRSRYVLIGVLVGIALGLIGGAWSMPAWLRWKLACFAAVMACGVGIRLSLLSHFRTWTAMERDGPSAEANAIVRQVYLRSTAILVLLWFFIAAVVILSVQKPG